MFYWATAISPGRFESNFRILVGTLILGIGQAVGSNVGLWTLQDRFTRRLRLLLTMPGIKSILCNRDASVRGATVNHTGDAVRLVGWC